MRAGCVHVVLGAPSSLNVLHFLSNVMGGSSSVRGVVAGSCRRDPKLDVSEHLRS